MAAIKISPQDFSANFGGVQFDSSSLFDKATVEFLGELATVVECPNADIEVENARPKIKFTFPFIIGDVNYTALVKLQKSGTQGQQGFVRISPRRAYAIDGFTVTELGSTSGAAKSDGIDGEPLTIVGHTYELV